MAQVLVNIRMDEDLKKSMEHTCQALGMNMTTAFTIFAKKVSREQRIPFEVSVDPFYSARNMAAIDEAARQIEQGKAVVKTIEELEAMDIMRDRLYNHRRNNVKSYQVNEMAKLTEQQLEELAEESAKNPPPLSGEPGYFSRNIIKGGW
jgi:DNA-damage-inducible protein J